MIEISKIDELLKEKIFCARVGCRLAKIFTWSASKSENYKDRYTCKILDRDVDDPKGNVIYATVHCCFVKRDIRKPDELIKCDVYAGDTERAQKESE